MKLSYPQLFLAACILSIGWGGSAVAQPVLALPAGAIPSCPVASGPCVAVGQTASPRATAAFFLVNFQGLPAGLSVANSLTYTGWSADMWPPYSATATYTLYSTYNPPSDSAWVNWGAINWILNNKPNAATLVGFDPSYSAADNLQYVVQRAIWDVITAGNAFGGGTNLDTVAYNLYQTALTHGNFVPVAGQTVGVLLHVDGITAVAMPTNLVEDPMIEVIVPAPPTGPFLTEGQGAWGAPPHGNNPGAILAANFAKVYPSGHVTVGGRYTLTFDRASAIRAFLPAKGPFHPLSASYVDPTNSFLAGEFAGEVLALQLNVDFSTAGVFRPGLANLTVQFGSLRGWTVAQVLAAANQVLGGGAPPAGVSLDALQLNVAAINASFEFTGASLFLK